MILARKTCTSFSSFFVTSVLSYCSTPPPPPTHTHTKINPSTKRGGAYLFTKFKLQVSQTEIAAFNVNFILYKKSAKNYDIWFSARTRMKQLQSLKTGYSPPPPPPDSVNCTAPPPDSVNCKARTGLLKLVRASFSVICFFTMENRAPMYLKNILHIFWL